MGKKTILFLAAISLLIPFFTTAYAAEKPFYDGKTITIIVTTKPGGGYDFYARLMAKYMQKYLPGSTIIVKNVPGAGHIIGCNTIYAAKPDGLTFGTFNRALALAQMTGLKGVKFDQAKMSWIGIACTEAFSLITVNKFKNLEDVKKAEQVRFVSEGIGAINYLATNLFEYMSGWKNISLATGYGGTEQQLALMRGEADAIFASWFSWLKFVKEGNGHPLMFISDVQPKGYENVPLIRDVFKDAKSKPLIDLLISINQLGRPFAGPPGIPEDRLKILRDAFEKACNDPEVVEVAAKAEKPIEYYSGPQAERYVKKLLTLPPEVIELVKKAEAAK